MAAFVDNARIQMVGLAGRVICAANRLGVVGSAVLALAAPLLPIAEGSDDHGQYLRFEVLEGDVSANEAKTYAGRLTAAPRRAMLTFEALGNVPRWGKRLTQHTGLVIEPGPMVKPNLFVALMQWNAAPSKSGIAGAPPPAEFGIRSVNVLKDGKVVKDARGIPKLEERFYYTLRWPGGEHTILSSEPLIRGKFYRDIGLAFVDGRGGTERAEFWLNGKLQGAIYTGPTGYPDHRSAYDGFGVYCHVGQVSPIAARFYGWRAAPVA